MRRFILFAFIGTFLMRDVASRIHRYPADLVRLFGTKRSSDNEEGKRTVCETQECKNMAKSILGGMNRSVDPCNDFYEYACGNWPKENPLPVGYNQWDMLTKLQIKTNKQVEEIVKAEPTESDLEVVKLAKKWYKVCTDTDAIKEEGLEPLVSTLSRLGGWPMITDKWDEQKYSWQKVDDDYMRLTGRNTFHDVRIDKDDTTVVQIDSPHLPPGSDKLRSVIESDSEEGSSESDEDSSDEEEQSEEKPGSEGEDDSKFIPTDNDDDDYDDDYDDDDDDDSNDDNSDDNSNDSNDDNDDDENDTDEQDKEIKKKIDKKKIIRKIGHGKNKKSRHVKQKKSGSQIIKKNDSHKKRQRIKRQSQKAISEVHSKRAQRFNHREKLHARKDRRNHVRKVHRKRTKKILSNEKTLVITEDGKLIRQYADYISNVAGVIAREEGTEISQERLDEDIQDMINFQMKLIQIIPSNSVLNNIFNLLFNLETTLGDFQKWYDAKNPKTAKSKIDWVNKIKTLFDQADEPVDNNLNLNVLPKYIRNLLSLLDETSNRTIVNYVHWNFISKIIKTTTSEMTKLYYSWQKIYKDKGEGSRDSNCLQSPEIKDILAYEFVRKYFSNDIMETISNLISDIRKEVENLIKKSDWMDDEAKDFALVKIKNMKEFIGYPDWYKNTTIIQEYYKGFDITSSYYENIIRYNKYIKQKKLRKLFKNYEERNKDEEIDPVEVNAFYLPLRNTLSLTAADFQSPWFAYDRPRSVNFGIIGFIVGHEINHGFDNQGHMFDKDGEFLGWFSAMASSYDKKQDCFVNQFNNYPVDKRTNQTIEDYGEQTIGDNIADTMGLQAIFKTFQRKEKESETPDDKLPGMEDFTSNQLFFLSFANLWCEAVNQNKIIEMAQIDVHSVNRLRIIGSVSNSDDFAKAFNCPVGSAMNPKKKCNIWK